MDGIFTFIESPQMHMTNFTNDGKFIMAKKQRWEGMDKH